MTCEWLLENVFVLRDFLSPEECQRQIALTEGDGYIPAGLTVGPDKYVQAPEIRNNDRVIRDDPELASQLWRRASPCTPPQFEEWTAIGLNERFRYYRYQPGQRFAPHYDGKFRRDAHEQSKLTFMVYLNDEFQGGETIFYSDRERELLRVQPRAGMALVFKHAILHEGSSVVAGTKYVLRTDVMYRSATAPARPS
ncbi:MAG: hypothetical protein AMXMBFR33_32520 [Candidatus Xenobia bacterium]